MRYFLISTMGQTSNGSLALQTFQIVTEQEHPTMKKCLEVSDEKYPNLKNVALVSISEFSQKDWEIFTSE